MGLLSIVNFQAIALSCIGALIAYRIYWETTTGAARRALAKKHGCLPAKQHRSKYPSFGLDIAWVNNSAYREHRLLESWATSLTSSNSHTLTTKILGQAIYWTDDPENVKTMLATNFDQWSLGQERIQHMSSFLGLGIFTSEGAAWKHSREMLRPCFERSQVADVSIMETHTGRLLQNVPQDGTTVDLQPLFHELTLDIATAFLFGRSTNALDHSSKDNACKEFIDAFEYCQNPMTERSEKYGVWAMFLPDRKMKRCAKVIRGTFFVMHFLPCG
jgi:cytochrome P450